VSGPFFDWVLATCFLDFDLNTKSSVAAIWDSGNNKVTLTNTYTIGKALAAILFKPALAESTKNQYVAISFHTRQPE
jgi:hypothetical protein